MKLYLLAICLAAGSAGAAAQNIDIQIGQSDYYGRIDLLNFGSPQVIYKEPVWVQRPVNYRTVQPLYLRVPPGHASKWSKHCARYDACGRPVYFVQDSWYSNTYAPRYRKVKGNDYRDDRRERDNNYRLSERHDDDHGRDKHNGKHAKHDKHDKHDKHEGKGKGHGKHKD